MGGAVSVPATSLAAYHSLGSIPSSLGDEICNLLELAGPEGLISDDIFACLSRSGRNDSSITTRYSELEDGKRIYRAGDTRPGKSGRQQQVMRHIKFLSVVPMLAPKVAPKSKVFKKGADWGLRRAAKILMANPVFKGTPEVRAIIKEIKELGV